MWKNEWTLFLISKESGKEMLHWTANTRQRCREELTSLKNQCGGKLPKGIKGTIRKVRSVNEIVYVPSSGYSPSGYAFGGPVV